jgi:hypothetical protein
MKGLLSLLIAVTCVALTVASSIDLSAFIVQLPVLTESGGVWAVNGSEAQLHGHYVDERNKELDASIGKKFFKSNLPKEDSIMIYCPINGVTTAHAAYARTELREGASGDGWKLNDKVSREMQITMSVQAVPADNNRLTIGQVHGNINSPPVVMVEVNFKDSDWNTVSHKFKQKLSLNSKFQFQISVDGMTMKVTDGVQTFSQDYSHKTFTSDTYYFKTGAYTQTKKGKDHALVTLHAIHLTNPLLL